MWRRDLRTLGMCLLCGSLGVRAFLFVLFFLLSSTCSYAQDAPKSEPNVDRPGGDLKSIELQQANPALCSRACEAEAECKAYTYVKPGVQGSAARCWLKSSVPPPVRKACCTSGVKLAATSPPEGTQPAICPPAAGAIQRTVYGWSQYKRAVQELPPDQQAILADVGNLLKNSFQPGCTPVRTVEVQGHADYDTPRNLQREQQYSEDRAQAATDWLKSYVGDSIAGQISWDTKGFGATQLKAEPTTEANRKQNRRVEILAHYSSAPTTFGLSECATCDGPNKPTCGKKRLMQPREQEIVANFVNRESPDPAFDMTIGRTIVDNKSIEHAALIFRRNDGSFRMGATASSQITANEETSPSNIFLRSPVPCNKPHAKEGEDCVAGDEQWVGMIHSHTGATTPLCQSLKPDLPSARDFAAMPPGTFTHSYVVGASGVGPFFGAVLFEPQFKPHGRLTTLMPQP
jgi:outer membrane protein OmpA-like peptidoglycan-associated protein